MTTPELDSHGTPWNHLIHSRGMKRNADGRWRKRRNAVGPSAKLRNVSVPPAPMPPTWPAPGLGAAPKTRQEGFFTITDLPPPAPPPPAPPPPAPPPPAPPERPEVAWFLRKNDWATVNILRTIHDLADFGFSRDQAIQIACAATLSRAMPT